MSEVLFLRSEPDLGSGFLRFPDLKNRLEQDLNLVQTLPDLEALIGSVNDLMKDRNHSMDEKSFLKRIRQRAYDRRRNFKPTIFEHNKDEKESCPMFEPVHEPIIQSITSVIPHQIQPASMKVEVSPGNKIWQGVQKGIGKIDGEKLIRDLPGFLLLGIATLIASSLVWLQSLDLYKASGFSQPALAAVGAIAMILGFAGVHATSRSVLALILCLYAAGYEGYFMISGTVQNEAVSLKASVEKDPELVFLGEKAEKTKAAYLTVKARYDDPTSEVYNNDWFKKKHLDPAWDLHEKDQNVFLAKRSALELQNNSDHITWLKIMYRLGLVFLCMVLVHKFVARLTKVCI